MTDDGVNGWDQYRRLLLRDLEQLHGNIKELQSELVNLNNSVLGIQQDVVRVKRWIKRQNQLHEKALEAQKHVQKEREAGKWTLVTAIVTGILGIVGMAVTALLTLL